MPRWPSSAISTCNMPISSACSAPRAASCGPCQPLIPSLLGVVVCAGISLSWRELPEALIDRHRLEDRLVVRHGGADREIRFLYRDPRPLIPAWVGNELGIYSWGGKGKLPRTGWVTVESLEAGRWRDIAPEQVDIPATFGCERGIWFQIREGLKGVLARDENERPHIYLLTQPASHYYQVMTRSSRMPVFLGDDRFSN